MGPSRNDATDKTVVWALARASDLVNTPLAAVTTYHAFRKAGPPNVSTRTRGRSPAIGQRP